MARGRRNGMGWSGLGGAGGIMVMEGLSSGYRFPRAHSRVPVGLTASQGRFKNLLALAIVHSD